MARTGGDNKALARVDLVVGALDIELHGAVNHLDERIEGSGVLGQTLSFVEAEHRHTTRCIVHKLFAHYAAQNDLHTLLAAKTLPFSNFSIAYFF